MSIIEKLGVKQIPRYTVIGVFEDDDKYEMCLEKDIKEPEQQRNETIIKMIEDILGIKNQTKYYEKICESIIKYLEILTGKSWSEIKELI